MRIELTGLDWRLVKKIIPAGNVDHQEGFSSRPLGIITPGYITNLALQTYLGQLLDAARQEGYLAGTGKKQLVGAMAEAIQQLDAADQPAPAHPGWLVWNPNTRQPNYQHNSIKLAEIEAQRLADTNPDQPFYVYGPLTCARSQRIVVKSKLLSVPARTEVDLDDEIPF